MDQPKVSSQVNEQQNSHQDFSEMEREEDPSLLIHQEVLQGSRLGDVHVRWVRPSHPLFRRLDAGLLEATEHVDVPRTSWQRFNTGLKRTLIGAPLATVRIEHERLTKFKALAVLSSDAISSVAYATEAILATLIAAGSGNLKYTLFICLAIAALLIIVALSYRQTIPAYPNGGGSYIVAKDNLGTMPGLVAAASLMIDYVLTVSVSVAAGVQALATLFPSLGPIVVPIDVALVLLIMIVNLRGVRESATIFAIPTYLFVFSAALLIVVGCIKAFLFQHQPFIGTFHPMAQPVETLSVFLILRSFSAGCTAITGVEAISNGIPAFKKPESHNAAITLTWMATILVTLFIGITILALTYGIEANPAGNPTVVGQIAQRVFSGPLFFMYPVFQIATLFILTLAANTSYSDFPRLASLLARDHYLPHQFAFRGDRLAFSIGIIVLGVLAALLLIPFKGDTTLLLNLYAVGVFMAFTLSQAGMVLHWWRLRNSHKGWLRSMIINGVGACATALVVVIIAVTKFRDGAWIVVFLIPLLIMMFVGIHRHYQRVERERTTDLSAHPDEIHTRLIVPLKEMNQVAKQSLAYARSLSEDVTAVYYKEHAKKDAAFKAAWDAWQDELVANEQVHLDVIDGRRSCVSALLGYINTMQRTYQDETLQVILPEREAETSAFKRLLAYVSSLRLKLALYFHPQIIVTNVSSSEQKSTALIHPLEIKHRFIVPVAELDRPSIQGLAYARSISCHVAAVHVAVDAQEEARIQAKWQQLQTQLTKGGETKLVMIESPYRSLLRPLLAYIRTIHELHPQDTLTVILPEYVVAHWWEYPLHNQTALQLKTALLAEPGIVVTNIPQHL